MVSPKVQLSSNYYFRKYQQFERKLDDISDYIPIVRGHTFNEPRYQFGSNKLCDFATEIGTFVDSLFSTIRKSENVKLVTGIKRIDRRKRIKQEWEFRRLLLNKFQISETTLNADFSLLPFVSFDGFLTTPAKILRKKSCWYPKYSWYKHDTEKLMNVWTLKDCLYSLGCAYVLTLFCTKIVFNADHLNYCEFSHYFFNNPHDFWNGNEHGSKGWDNIIFEARQKKKEGGAGFLPK
jgi:hypothetical protein